MHQDTIKCMRKSLILRRWFAEVSRFRQFFGLFALQRDTGAFQTQGDAVALTTVTIVTNVVSERFFKKIPG